MAVARNQKSQAPSKKEVMKPFSMKMSDADEEKLEKIRQSLNMDTFASVIRKMIRDYKIVENN
jgi:hypothetical protein